MNRPRRARLTRLGRLVLATAAVLGVLATLTADSWLLLLAAAAAGLEIASGVTTPRLTDLEVAVELPARATAGSALECTVRVRNAGTRSVTPFVVGHACAGLTDAAVVVPGGLRPGEELVAAVARNVLSRGVATSARVTVRSGTPFGLRAVELSFDDPVQLVRHPATRRVDLAPPAAAGDDDRTAVPDRSGLDVRGVREWRGGDEGRQVHWRSTARHGRLMVLERQAPRSRDLVVLVAGSATHPGWEELVALVASAAVAAGRHSRAVSLVVRQPGLSPCRAASSRTRLLDWCAALGEPRVPTAHEVALAARYAGRGGVVLVAATELPAAWWAAARRTAATVGVDVEALQRAVRA